MPAHIRHVARQIEEAGSALLGREALARRKAAMHERAARRNGPMVALVVVFALLITWWFVAGVSGVAAKLPPVVTGPLVVITVVATIGLGMLWVSMMRAPDDEELGAVGLARCGNCGGFVPFRQGEAFGACEYCQAHALEPATLARELLARGHAAAQAGERDLDAAVAENWRTAREARVGGIRFGVGGWVAVCIVGACGMTAAIVYGLLSKGQDSYPTWWIWIAVVGAAIAMIALVVRGVKRTMADNQRFERRFGVRLVAGADDYRPR